MEKTLDAAAAYLLVGKHLHGRGEDSLIPPRVGFALETPPWTWRRPSPVPRIPITRGNTSTDVEKTTANCQAARASLETPPRTWRRPSSRCSRPAQSRNTSTDVEKTLAATTVGNYALETPPRTWRRQLPREQALAVARNTSTDVEKTRHSHAQ